MSVQKTKKCTSCGGGGVTPSLKMDGHKINTICVTCEGTGVKLFDEESDDMHNLYIDDDTYFKEDD